GNGGAGMQPDAVLDFYLLLAIHVQWMGLPRSALVSICNAPMVEGAVIAAAEASGGASLDKVVATAEELSP
ncbi:hypothetical protein ACC677_37795, partial [Rhizobium ruizarguesonis]